MRLLVGTLGLIGTVYASRAASGADPTANPRVQALVEASCRLEGGTLDFGTYRPEQNNAEKARTRIKYRCPEGLDITLKLGPGEHSVDGRRGMQGGGSNGEDDDDDDDILAYQLFKYQSLAETWGDGTSNGTGLNIPDTPGGGPKSVNVFGEIPADQEVPPGAYNDTVLITLVIGP